MNVFDPIHWRLLSFKQIIPWKISSNFSTSIGSTSQIGNHFGWFLCNCWPEVVPSIKCFFSIAYLFNSSWISIIQSFVDCLFNSKFLEETTRVNMFLSLLVPAKLDIIMNYLLVFEILTVYVSICKFVKLYMNMFIWLWSWSVCFFGNTEWQWHKTITLVCILYCDSCSTYMYQMYYVCIM